MCRILSGALEGCHVSVIRTNCGQESRIYGPTRCILCVRDLALISSIEYESLLFGLWALGAR